MKYKQILTNFITFNLMILFYKIFFTGLEFNISITLFIFIKQVSVYFLRKIFIFINLIVMHCCKKIILSTYHNHL